VDAPSAPPSILSNICQLDVLALNYCCSTSCQYIGVAKFAHRVALLQHYAPSENGSMGRIGRKRVDTRHKLGYVSRGRCIIKMAGSVQQLCRGCDQLIIKDGVWSHRSYMQGLRVVPADDPTSNSQFPEHAIPVQPSSFGRNHMSATFSS
jgi:hypothetical protein